VIFGEELNMDEFFQFVKEAAEDAIDAVEDAIDSGFNSPDSPRSSNPPDSPASLSPNPYTDKQEGRRRMSALDDTTLPFLHGTLLVKIEEAKDLPDTDSAFWTTAKNVTDAFARAKLMPIAFKIGETKVVNDSLYPAWNEEFHLLCCHNSTTIRIEVVDKDFYFGGGDPIGFVDIETHRLIEEEVIDDWFELQCNGDGEVQGSLKVTIRYLPKEGPSNQKRKFLQEKNYFETRERNKMVLYQCADTPNLPVFQGVLNPDGSEYVPPRLWKDTYDAICNAEKLIYIVGWSVDTSKSLLRGEDDPDESLSNLGELLKRRAEEGVRVLLMIWNDRTSGALSRGGQMGTHDEITEEFFADSPVQVANVPRILEGGDVGVLESEMARTIFTHHQKFVLTDAEDPDSGKRRLIAFLGGIDLTDGRYETPEYRLFDYAATHWNDFYQNCYSGATPESGPREPWHDIHCRLEGTITNDILHNFEARWKKQAQDKIGSLYELTDDEFDLESTPGDEDGGLWSIQLFRSITSDSCLFEEDRLNSLTGKTGYVIEDSIQRAYINEIREADHFIYIENQYFLGSAYAWRHYRDTSCKHSVPREIVEKIIEKINAEERFTVYVTIPLFPEGDPASNASQEILYWQHLTMEGMYTRIGNALKKVKSEAHPMDYLMFFSPCKSEGSDQVPEGMAEPDPDTQAAKVRASLRHPIYVHSKMMIVDDDYIIVGSANINQRSLSGSRDSEIAVGGQQVDHQAQDHDGQPRGAIHTFRLALWSAHLGGLREEFSNPASQECVDVVRQITQEYQELYLSEETQFSQVHLLPYPIQVNQNGSVENIQGWKNFPDTEAPVFGGISMLPNYNNKITT